MIRSQNGEISIPIRRDMRETHLSLSFALSFSLPCEDTERAHPSASQEENFQWEMNRPTT